MIRNDLGDYLVVEKVSKLSKGMKGISHSDIQEGKVDIAYLVALHSPVLKKQEQTFLMNCLFRKLTKNEKLNINKLLWKSGAVDLTVELIAQLISHVKKHLLPEYQETPTRMKWMFNLVEITTEIHAPFKNEARKNKWIKYEFDTELLQNITKKILDLEKIPNNRRLSRYDNFEQEY